MDVWYKVVFKLQTAFLVASVCVEAAQCGFSVVQSPEYQLVPLGSSLTLNCSYDLPAVWSRVRVSWVLSQITQSGNQTQQRISSSGVFAHNVNMTEVDPKGLVHQVTGNTWSTLTLKRAEVEDSGMYFCKVTVEIPTLQECNGNGTEVMINTPLPLEKSVNAGWWVWVTVVAGIAVVAALGGLWIFMKLKHQRNLRENPVYANMHVTVRKAPATQPALRPGVQTRSRDQKHLGALRTPRTPSKEQSQKPRT